jgi:hypothetical protein
MATTNATLTITSADLTGDALSLSTTATLTTSTSATTGLDETTGVARKNYDSAVSNSLLIDSADYGTGANKIYIKNASSTASNSVQIELGSTHLVLGKLYGGDWAFFPYEGTNDIDITTTGSNVVVEYMVIYES